MSTAGPNAFGTISDDSAVGTLTWSNPANGGADDASYATAATTTTATTHYIKFLNPGFSIPAGTINGISITVNRKASSDGGRHVRDITVSLVIGGSVTGDNKADTSTNWPTTDGDKTYGGSSDVWGASPTVSQVNASNFGFVLSAEITSSVVTTTAYVDYASISVTYTASGGGAGLVTRKALLGVGL